MIMGLAAPDPFIYMGTGTSATAESSAQTALLTENVSNGAQRAAATTSYPGLGISQWSILYAFTGAVTIRELAIYNTLVAGLMYMRHVLSENKNYSDGESVEITIQNYSTRVTL
jgi:hypothetical protein